MTPRDDRDWVEVAVGLPVLDSAVECHGCAVGLLLSEEQEFHLATDPDLVLLCPECGESLRAFVEGGGGSP